MSRAIDADALEKEGWSLHRTIRVDKNTEEYQTKPLRKVSTIEPDPSQCWGCNCEKMERLEPCEDTISRQDAINLIERYCDNGCEIAEDKWCPDCQQSKFAEMIKALPPSPSRPKGKWIPQNLNKSDGMISTAVYYYPKCSVCGANANYTNFCPNCGADMREDGEADADVKS